ncbi:hypothetical protein TRVL_05719 [Trypanosoma vivax]|nr:hypothetical protein TRVL_05719 [Trypanosoma vivax]
MWHADVVSTYIHSVRHVKVRVPVARVCNKFAACSILRPADAFAAPNLLGRIACNTGSSALPTSTCPNCRAPFHFALWSHASRCALIAPSFRCNFPESARRVFLSISACLPLLMHHAVLDFAKKKTKGVAVTPTVNAQGLIVCIKL